MITKKGSERLGSVLKIDIRRGKILEKIKRDGTVSVSQLAEELGATPVTIRSDLDALEAEGYLIRVQGGAVQNQRSAASGLRTPGMTLEKQAIARAVADCIGDGDTIFINSGSTMQAVAEALHVRKNLNVVTNCLAVAAELGAVPGFRVILLGGEVNARYGFSYGSDAQEQLSHYQADWAIMSLDGIDSDGGLTTYHAEEATINRMMVQRSKRLIVAAEYKKVGKKGFFRFYDVSPNMLLVTDARLSEQAVEPLRAAGLEILTV